MAFCLANQLDLKIWYRGRATDATTGTTTEFATYITTTTDSGGELPDIQRKWLGIDQDS